MIILSEMNNNIYHESKPNRCWKALCELTKIFFNLCYNDKLLKEIFC